LYIFDLLDGPVHLGKGIRSSDQLLRLLKHRYGNQTCDLSKERVSLDTY
jgi:hypothetical protein